MFGGGLSVSDIIDGTGNCELDEGQHNVVEDDGMVTDFEPSDRDETMDADDDLDAFIGDVVETQDEDERETDGEITQQQLDKDASASSPLKRSATDWLNNNFGGAPTPPQSAESIFEQPRPQDNEDIHALEGIL